MREIKIYDSCLWTRAPAFNLDGNPDHKRIVLVHDNGIEECIFLGKEFVQEDYEKKAKAQGKLPREFP